MTAIELIKNVPELADIAERLDATFQQAEQAKQANNKGVVADNFIITQYYTNGKWTPTYITIPQAGKSNFIQALDKQLSRGMKIQGVEIKITKGKGSGRGKTPPEYPQVFFEGGIGNPDSKIAEKMAALEEKANSGEPTTAWKIEFETLKLELKHQQEKGAWELKERDYLHRIAALEEEVSALEEELEETDSELGSVEEQKKTNDLLDRGLNLGERFIEHFVFDGKSGDAKALPKKEDGSSFTPAGGGDDSIALAGIEDKRKTDLKKLFELFKTLPNDQFSNVFKVIAHLQDDKGEISKEKATGVLAYLATTKPAKATA